MNSNPFDFSFFGCSVGQFPPCSEINASSVAFFVNVFVLTQTVEHLCMGVKDQVSLHPACNGFKGCPSLAKLFNSLWRTCKPLWYEDFALVYRSSANNDHDQGNYGN